MGKGNMGKSRSVSYGILQKISRDKAACVHFIGIGGVSMCSLAALTMLRGARVSGSDKDKSPRTQALLNGGAEIYVGHNADNVGDASLVVYSHAISEDNPELIYARSVGVPCVSRAEYLGAMMLDYGRRIGVSGSHGKSTTVAMLERIFTICGYDPTVLCGASLPGGLPYKIGGADNLIYEACEYKDSFLKFTPHIAVALNLELDHTDYFESIDSICHSFELALNRAGNLSVINGDDENLQSIKPKLKCPFVTFGSGELNDYRYSITSFKEVGYEFSLFRKEVFIGNFEINIPGAFNVHNATAAIIVALESGLPNEKIAIAIKSYKGIPGRLEYIGSRYGRPVYYDYAHHPTEISASVTALRQITNRPITIVFKPHTYSRTASLWRDFCSALSAADHTVVADIYPAREEAIEGISSARLAEEIGHGAFYCPDEEIISAIDGRTSGAIVLMGAGDFESLKSRVIQK